MWGTVLFAAALFWALIPGNLVTFPAGGSRLMVNLVHALLFGVVWTLTHRTVALFVGRL